jgi:NAD(P)-dependent dehydrogenase (short-subunit alcohol dehydrogenase family)
MLSDALRLTGQIALVTGGTRGIGLACVRALAEAGAQVCFSGRSQQEGEAAESALGQEGLSCKYIRADVASSPAVRDLIDQVVGEFGKIDILVNNAGICRYGPTVDFDDATWRDIIDTNLSGVFWCCREAARHMLKNGGGSIVNIGSISGFISNIPQEQAAYNASKGAVHMLTKSLASEYAGRNIRVNAVAPGYIDTAMTRPGFDNPEWAPIWLGNTPMARVGRPEEVAFPVVFLASSAASYMTGAILIIDGGYTLR